MNFPKNCRNDTKTHKQKVPGFDENSDPITWSHGSNHLNQPSIRILKTHFLQMISLISHPLLFWGFLWGIKFSQLKNVGWFLWPCGHKNRAYVYFQIPGTVKLDPELHKKDTIYHQTSRRLLGGKTRLVRRLLSYISCQWFVGCFVPSCFFLKKGKGYKENWRSEGIFPNFLVSCNDLQKHCKPTKFIVKLQLSDRYLKLLPRKIMSWVTQYNSVAYDNKIRSKRTILSYTTLCFTKESTVHQKKKSRIFSHSTNLEPSCPPFYQLRGSRRDSPSACHGPNIQTLPRSQIAEKEIINRPSSIIINLCQKNHLRTDCPPPQRKKQIVFVLCVFLHENLQWNDFYQKNMSTK